MNFFTKASRKLAIPITDMNIIVNYIKADLRTQLDSARYMKSTGMLTDIESDPEVTQAGQLIESVIRDMDQINKRTDQIKASLKKEKGADLSPDEIYTIGISALRDIKKAGLKRQLTKEERDLLKNTTKRFSVLYSEQLQIYKQREKQQR